VPVTLDDRGRRTVRIAAAVAILVIVALVGFYVLHAVTAPRVGAADAVRTVATVPSGSGGDNVCVDRVARPAGWMDLCWEVARITEELDPEDDYWVVRAFGTVRGDPPSGVKWAILHATYQGDADRTRERSPIGTSDGPCREVEIDPGWIRSPSLIPRTITACEHLEGSQDGGSVMAIWTCGSCIFGIQEDREIALVQIATTAAGDSPSWELSAGFGG
jgi:hypothetical protein